MSHFYPNLIIEIEPGVHYYVADGLSDPDDPDTELSRYPRYRGGPFSSQEDAVRAMIGARGNPGFTESISHESILAADEWVMATMREKIDGRPSIAPGTDDAPTL